MFTESFYFLQKIGVSAFLMFDFMKELEHDLITVGQNHIQYLWPPLEFVDRENQNNSKVVQLCTIFCDVKC